MSSRFINTINFTSENSLIGIGPSAFGHIFFSELSVSYYNLPSLSEYNNQVCSSNLPFWKATLLNPNSKKMYGLINGHLNMLRNFAIDMFDNEMKLKLTNVLSVFQKLGLISINNHVFQLTEKGTLRVEEMAYYLARLDFREKQTADIDDTYYIPLFCLECEKQSEHNDYSQNYCVFRYHCFPNRTPSQLSNWNESTKKINYLLGGNYEDVKQDYETTN
jgi:hypothetical protein